MLHRARITFWKTPFFQSIQAMIQYLLIKKVENIYSKINVLISQKINEVKQKIQQVWKIAATVTSFQRINIFTWSASNLLLMELSIKPENLSTLLLLLSSHLDTSTEIIQNQGTCCTFKIICSIYSATETNSNFVQTIFLKWNCHTKIQWDQYSVSLLFWILYL